MFVGSAGAVVVLLVLVGPLTTPLRMEGALVLSDPAGLAGLLAADAGEPGARLIARWDAVELPAPVHALDADQLEARIVRFEEPGVPPLPLQWSVAVPPLGRGRSIEAFNATGADLWIERINRFARMDLQGSGLDPAADPASWVNATVAACKIRRLPSAAAYPFPDDPGVQSKVDADPPRPVGHLEATCRTTHQAAWMPARVTLFGVDVRLVSRETDRKIRTGTFEESDPRALYPTRVTQWLEIFPRGSVLSVAVPNLGNATVSSPRFEALGTLSLGPATGTLQWGALRKEGPIGAFAARGRFDLAWAPQDRVKIAGETWDGPPFRPVANGPANPLPAAVGATAAALALAVLVRAAWVLFSKIASDRLLDHPRRARIYDLVAREPGVTLARVARAAGAGWAKALHHVRKLEAGGLVRLHHVGRRTALFPQRGNFRGAEARWSTLGRATARGIYDELLRSPGLGRAQLAERLHLSRPRITQSLQPLVRLGLVEAHREGKRHRYFARPTGPAQFPSDPAAAAHR